jgi:hypothetical protein
MLISLTRARWRKLASDRGATHGQVTAVVALNEHADGESAGTRVEST